MFHSQEFEKVPGNESSTKLTNPKKISSPKEMTIKTSSPGIKQTNSGIEQI